MTNIDVVRGDITKAEVDAIVNAANEWMLGGGGVDGAIHRAAGKSLRKACEAVPEVCPGVRCPTGEARITQGFLLPARYVIHTVGPRYSMPNATALLESAFRSSLTLASDHADIRTVALPAVSCGVFGYPIEEAAEIAVRVAREREWDLDEIRFVLFSESDRAAFARAVEG
jgi:O-acetyl-ADP-ribose deacetylase (regulator of RNase III)